DKDFAQLVSPRIRLVNTMTNTTLDEPGVVGKFGVSPDRIIDFLALTGDTVDNVPGVQKCGPKTAAKWLAEYGSLDRLIENADKVGGKIGQCLRDALGHLPLSRALVTIKTDVALDVGATDLLLREADGESLQRLYRRYEFNAALKDLEARHGKPAAAAAQASLVHDGTSPSSPAADASAAAEIAGPGTYELVVDQERFEYWLQKLSAADLICFDTETTSLDAMRAEIVGVSFAVEAKVAA